MDIDKMFPSKYLKASDLNGRQVVLTIKEVLEESIGPQQENKFVAYFRNTQKRLVLNQTNTRRIAAVAGSRNSDDWKGVKITLYVAEVEFKGKSGPGLRVLVPTEAAAEPPAPVKDNKKVIKTKKEKAVLPEPDDPIPEPEEPMDVVPEEDFDPDDEENIPF